MTQDQIPAISGLDDASQARVVLYQSGRLVHAPADSIGGLPPDLSPADGNFIVGDGTEFITESGNTARTSLGLGTGNSPTFTALTLLGGQLAFPATQNPSSDPNTLDDYEEGTWTPAFAFGGASTGYVYSSQIGAYTKIGRMVFIFFDVTLSTKGSATGAMTITGLPFTGVTNAGLMAISFAGGMNALNSSPFGTVTAATTTIQVRHNNPAGTGALSMDATNMTNTSRLQGAACYPAS